MMQPIPPEIAKQQPAPPSPTHGNASRAILGARQSWDKAPANVRMMAGAYVSPILQALEALHMDLEILKGASHGNHA
jgi:hypothetical protein